MIVVVLLVLFPLCLQRHIRQVKTVCVYLCMCVFRPSTKCLIGPLLQLLRFANPLILQFEKAATVGVVVVVLLMAIIIVKAATLGFPAVASGELPVFSLKAGPSLVNISLSPVLCVDTWEENTLYSLARQLTCNCMRRWMSICPRPSRSWDSPSTCNPC